MSRVTHTQASHPQSPLVSGTRDSLRPSVASSAPPALDQFVSLAQSAPPTFEIGHLKHAFPTSLDVTGTLSERIARFAARWPKQVRIIPNIGFEFKENVPPARRSVIVISLMPLVSSRTPVQDRDGLRADYLRAVAANTISFAMPKEPLHLYTRFAGHNYDFAGIGFREGHYGAFMEKLEPLVELGPQEMARMAQYIESGLANPDEVLGAFTSKEGPQDTNGTLSDNRPKEGKHNCTSWVTMAPIGNDGEQLRDLVMAPRKWIVHDNPGWWGKFLVGASRSPRCQNVVHWVHKSVDEVAEELSPGSTLRWSFDEK